MWDSAGTFIVALIYIAILYVLVRPGSQGTAAITAASTAVAGLVSAATGGGSITGTSTTGG